LGVVGSDQPYSVAYLLEKNTQKFNYFKSFLLVSHLAADVREGPSRSLIINYFRHAFLH
jgi:hypothetical protein